MLREYPVRKPSSAPATGRLLYTYLMKNIRIPASANHEIWYSGAEMQLSKPEDFAFRGDIPTGKTLDLLTLAQKPIMGRYTFVGNEAYVLVSDLSEASKLELKIPVSAREKDKVYNSNFKAFDDLPELTKVSNELAVLSVPKAISNYLAGVLGKVNYSERDVLNMINAAINDLSSPEMMNFMGSNHMAWSALAYMREKGNVEGDLLTEFHSQNPVDYYAKDLGTILPGLFFAAANLGQDPILLFNKLDTEVWGAKDAAIFMRKYLPK